MEEISPERLIAWHKETIERLCDDLKALDLLDAFPPPNPLHKEIRTRYKAKALHLVSNQLSAIRMGCSHLLVPIELSRYLNTDDLDQWHMALLGCTSNKQQRTINLLLADASFQKAQRTKGLPIEDVEASQNTSFVAQDMRGVIGTTWRGDLTGLGELCGQAPITRSRHYFSPPLGTHLLALYRACLLATPVKGCFFRVKKSGHEQTHYLAGTVHLSTPALFDHPTMKTMLQKGDRLVIECTHRAAHRASLQAQGAKAYGLAAIEAQIIVWAEAHQKPLYGLETVYEQLAALADGYGYPLGSQQRAAFIAEGVAGSPNIPQGDPVCDSPHGSILGTMRAIEPVIQGDLKTIAAMHIANAPKQAQEHILFKRNRAWMPQLKTWFSDTKQVTAVFVGAGHLPTDQGVIQLLQNAGFTIEQL